VDAAPTTARARRFEPLVLVAALVFLTGRLFIFVGRHAVNVLYFDQWDFWEGLFEGRGALSLFRWQHGPHRQGLGSLVVLATALASGWDVRAECFVSASLIALAAALALLLARRLRGSFALGDLCIPLMYLTLSSFELFVVSPNPAHGALPLLLVTVYALALQLERAPVRVPCLVAVAFLATYTGFGFFLGPVSILVFAIETIRAVKERRELLLAASGFAASVLSLASFFHGYVFSPAVACFRFPDPHPEAYLEFLNVLFIRAVELQAVKPLRMGLGFALPLALGALVAWSGSRTLVSLARSRLHLTIFVLGAFSWLFAVDAAVGRACLGAGQAGASRYVPYLVPILLAAYLFLSVGEKARWRTALLLAFALLCVGKEIWGPRNWEGVVDAYERGKQRWVACYLAEASVARCNAETGFPIYPYATATPRIERDLAYLRAHRLSFFRR
jgi:hypothetical protein